MRQVWLRLCNDRGLMALLAAAALPNGLWLFLRVLAAMDGPYAPEWLVAGLGPERPDASLTRLTLELPFEVLRWFLAVAVYASLLSSISASEHSTARHGLRIARDRLPLIVRYAALWAAFTLLVDGLIVFGGLPGLIAVMTWIAAPAVTLLALPIIALRDDLIADVVRGSASMLDRLAKNFPGVAVLGAGYVVISVSLSWQSGADQSLSSESGSSNVLNVGSAAAAGLIGAAVTATTLVWLAALVRIDTGTPSPATRVSDHRASACIAPSQLMREIQSLWKILRGRRAASILMMLHLLPIPAAMTLYVLRVPGFEQASESGLASMPLSIAGTVSALFGLFLLECVSSLIVVAFYSALLRLEADEPWGIRRSIGAAWSAAPAVATFVAVWFAWALVIDLLAQRGIVPGSLPLVLITLEPVLTMLVLPILALEPVGFWCAVKRSARLVGRHWSTIAVWMFGGGFVVLVAFAVGAVVETMLLDDARSQDNEPAIGETIITLLVAVMMCGVVLFLTLWNAAFYQLATTAEALQKDRNRS